MFPRFLSFLGIVVLPAFLASAWGAEIIVNQKGGGNCKTISEAVKAAKAGDTVTVKAGVYRENVTITKKGAAAQPFTLRAAPGENVVVSGFQPIRGWQKFNENIYTTMVDWPARDLYVGWQPQMISRDPNTVNPWHHVASVQGNEIKVDDALPKTITGKDVFLFSFRHSDQFQDFISVNQVALDAKTITARDKAPCGVNDRFVICNDPGLITEPGFWAYEALDGKKTKLYFWPKQPADLEKTQSRPGVFKTPSPGPVVGIIGSEHVRIEGLEVVGGGDSVLSGIGVQDSKNVTVENCVIHDNGADNGAGISTLKALDVVIRHCLLVRNHFGIIVDQSHRVTVEENEIAFTMEDGFRIQALFSRWKESMKAPPFPADFGCSDEIIVRRNYVHHALWLRHPDAMQSWCFRRSRFEDNLNMLAGQGWWAGSTVDVSCVGNTILGMFSNGTVIGTNGPSKNMTIQRNTIIWSRWSAFNQLKNHFKNVFTDNIIYGNNLKHLPTEYEGDRNIVWNCGIGGEAFSVADGQDKQSVAADPLLKNIPQAFATAGDPKGNEVDKYPLSRLQLFSLLPIKTAFHVGDNIEINGDGRCRKITAMDDTTITINPPLSMRPIRGDDIQVWNWGKRTDFQVDTRPDPHGPVSKMPKNGGATGSQIDVKAFQAGDLSGSGKRVLPPIPEDLKKAWPDPTNMVIPVSGF